MVGASAKMQRPPADRGRKTDRRDAEFLARLLSTGNVCEAWVPDEECEAARDLSRALEDARDDLQRARQRLSKFLLRHGLVYDEYTPGGRRRCAWTRAHARWLDGISFGEPDDAATYEYYRECVARCEEAKRGLEARVAESAGRPRWRPTVDALRCLKGIDTVTAHAKRSYSPRTGGIGGHSGCRRREALG
ncbi:MAG: transposase [Olsenella sp.]|nr:transposase [Olsenella sp.]